MQAYAINGQTSDKTFSGIMYRATALLAGFDAGTFLTQAAANVGGFYFEGEADFDSCWTGSGHKVIHPNYNVARMVSQVYIKRETPRVMRWAKLDGRTETETHREKVSRLAKNRRMEVRGIVKRHGAIAEALLAISPDSEAVTLACECLKAPDGDAVKRAWRDAFAACKELHLLTI